MTLQEVEEYAQQQEIEIPIFSNPSYEHSIIGISVDDRVIYDYDLMVQDLMQADNISEEEAIDFIEYNTIRALSYMENSPIILYTKGELESELPK